MEIFLDRASIENKEVLYKLLQYSLYEESETDGNEISMNGEFEYRYFDKYFTDKSRDAFIVREKDTLKILGFVMINTYVQKVTVGHSIAEFMIMPKYRKLGIGSKVANMCFNMYSGNWEIKPSVGSERAYLFWKKVIEKYTNNNYTFERGLFVFSK